MKYYVRTLASSATIGPYSVEEIEARLQTGELSVDALATVDTGESPAQAAVWLRVHQLPGLGGGRPPSSELPPPLPPPPQNVVNSPPSSTSGMVFCPACGHKLAPDARSTCDRCGKELIVNVKEPGKPRETKPMGWLPQFLTVIGAVFAALLLMLLGCLLLGLVLLSKCSSAQNSRRNPPPATAPLER